MTLSTAELEARMRPGALSQDGFLGEDEKLEEVMRGDSETLREIGVTYDELADGLEALLGPAVASRSRRAEVGRFSVEVKIYTGFQICPWTRDLHHAQCTDAGGVNFGSVDWCITNRARGLRLCGPGLITHLIKAHHFFEGHASHHRVDPRELARLLELGTYAKKSP